VQVSQELELVPEDDLGDMLSEISAAKSDDLCSLFVQEWTAGARSQWRAGLYLWRLHQERPYLKQVNQRTGSYYGSTIEWVESLDLPGLKAKSSASRVLSVIEEWVKLPPERRVLWSRESIWDAYDAKPVWKQEGEEKAYEIVSAPDTSAQKRQKVREITAPDQHHDPSPIRTFQVLITEDTLAQVRRATNAVRHQLGVANPTDNDVMDRWASDFLSGFYLQVGAAVYQGLDEMDLAMRQALVDVMAEDVLAGRMRCIECGIWWPIQSNHIPPRSQNIRRPDGEGMYHPDAPEWARAYTCEAHHSLFHATGWKANTQRLIAIPKNAWLKEKLQKFLGDRRLEDL
jgi:hypothetical protein